MQISARSLVATAGAVAVAAVPFVATAGAKTRAKPVKDSGTSYVAIDHMSGKTQYAAGYTFDKRFGRTAATYVTSLTPGTTGNVNVIAHRVTLYGPAGSLWGTGKAVESLATGKVSKGKLDLTHGTGAEKGHSFVGTFTGSFDPKSGVFTFHYKGVIR